MAGFSKKKIFLITLEVLAYFVVFLLLTNARISGILMPFGFGFLFALLYCKRNPLLVLPTFALAYLATTPNLVGLIIAFNTISVAVLAVMLYKILKKQPSFWAICLFAVFSQVGYIFFNIQTGMKILQTILTIVIGIIFLYTSMRFLSSVITKGFQSKLVVDESIGLAFLIIALSMGLFDVSVFGLSVASIVTAFLVLLVYFVKESQFALYFASLGGVGLAFANSSIVPLAIYCSWSVALLVTGRSNKYACAVVLVLIDALLGLFFNAYIDYSLYNILSVAVASLVFVAIPTKQLKRLRDYFASEHKPISEGYMANLNQENLKYRLKNIAHIFYEMQKHYRQMLVGEMNYEEVKNVLGEQITNKVCESCERYKSCHHSGDESIRSALYDMMFCGLKKKKITLVDLPPILASCNRPNTILAAGNQVLGEFFEYENILKKEDSGKIIVGEQLFGAGELIRKLAESISYGKRSDEARENSLRSDLLYSDIIVKECSIFENESGLYKAILLVKNTQADIKEIEKVAGEFFKLRVKATTNSPSIYAGWQMVVLEQAPRFDIIFGGANETKTGSEASGDTYSFVNLGSNRYMISLCDGMGSGNNAEKTSEFAISLIESFYRAGYDSNTTLSVVNKLLSSVNKENFSAIDVCVVDTVSGKIDFIKLGSSPSVIKKGNTAELVVSENLPLGIIDNTRPTIVKKFLQSGDIVVLASDGVYDSYGEEERFLAQINNEKLINMSMLAENIVEEAIQVSGGVKKDDMTVLALRLVQNI